MFQSGDVFAERYRIERLLGEGGFAKIYLATQDGLGRQVAIKVVDVAKRETQTDASRDEMAQLFERLNKRFAREAQVVSKLQSPYTVTLHDFGVENGTPYMVFEYIDGENLSELIAKGPVSPARVVSILQNVLESLEEAHNHDLMHRDIKPANIIVYRHMQKSERAKLLDFGIAKLFTEAEDTSRTNLTQEDQLVGTPRYMAPEQVMNPLDVSPAADLYALGLVAYELLLGVPANDGVDTMSLLANQISAQSFLVRKSDPVPEKLREIVNKMITKERDKRYLSAHEVLLSLSRLGPDDLRLPLDALDEIEVEFEALDPPRDPSEDATVVDSRELTLDRVGEVETQSNRWALVIFVLIVLAAGAAIFAVSFHEPETDSLGLPSQVVPSQIETSPVEVQPEVVKAQPEVMIPVPEPEPEPKMDEPAEAKVEKAPVKAKVKKTEVAKKTPKTTPPKTSGPDTTGSQIALDAVQPKAKAKSEEPKPKKKLDVFTMEP